VTLIPLLAISGNPTPSERDGGLHDDTDTKYIAFITPVIQALKPSSSARPNHNFARSIRVSSSTTNSSENSRRSKAAKRYTETLNNPISCSHGHASRPQFSRSGRRSRQTLMELRTKQTKFFTHPKKTFDRERGIHLFATFRAPTGYPPTACPAAPTVPKGASQPCRTASSSWPRSHRSFEP
jgi:hypothetical protein